MQLRRMKVTCEKRCMQGTVVLVMTAVRLLAPEGGEPWPWEVQQLVQQGLATAAACAPCSHKDVASAALSCLDALVGEWAGSSCADTASVAIQYE